MWELPTITAQNVRAVVITTDGVLSVHGGMGISLESYSTDRNCTMANTSDLDVRGGSHQEE